MVSDTCPAQPSASRASARARKGNYCHRLPRFSTSYEAVPMRKTRICPPVGAKMCGVTRVLMPGPLLLWAMCRTMRPHLALGLRLRRPARPRAVKVVQTRRPAPREKARPRIPTPKPSGREWAASSTKCQNPTPTQPLSLYASAILSRFRGHLIPPTAEYSHRTAPQLTQPALMIRLPGPA